MMLYDDENQIKIKLDIRISTFNMVVNNLDGQWGWNSYWDGVNPVPPTRMVPFVIYNLRKESIFIVGKYSVSGELDMRNLPCSKNKSFALFR